MPNGKKYLSSSVPRDLVTFYLKILNGVLLNLVRPLIAVNSFLIFKYFVRILKKTSNQVVYAVKGNYRGLLRESHSPGKIEG